jgi:ABC-type phosphate/phosphonate transport system substrate-binding protein
MRRLMAVFLLAVIVLAWCVRESPEKARQRAVQEELNMMRAVIE